VVTDTTVAAAIDAKATELKRVLGAATSAGLLKARLIVAEIEQNVYQDAVQTALTTVPRKMAARSTPYRPSAYDLVRFDAEFLKPFEAYNSSAAREAFVCAWRIGGVFKEGWTVWHYFVKPGPAEVTAKFLDSGGNELKDNNGNALELSIPMKVYKRSRSDAILLEILRSSLSVLIALIVLIAGIQDKIETLTLANAALTVFIIGLTSDSILKNLLAKSGP
jgi:hypothetical protein